MQNISDTAADEPFMDDNLRIKCRQISCLAE